MGLNMINAYILIAYYIGILTGMFLFKMILFAKEKKTISL